jgi:hypothetical protein
MRSPVMQCEEVRRYMAEIVYGEDSDLFPKEFKDHFSQCRECVTEYLELLEVKRCLSVWKDEEVPSRWVFVSEPKKKSHFHWEGWSIAWGRPAISYAVGIFLLIVGLAALRLQVSWGEGSVSLQSAWLSPERSAPPEGISSSMDSTRQQDLTAMLDKIMTGSEIRQNQQTLLLLQKAMETMDYQRQMDMVRLRGEIETLQHAYYQTIEKNNDLLEQNVRFMNRTKY